MNPQFGGLNSQTSKPGPSQIESFSIELPDRRPQDVKTFEFKVFGPKTSNSKLLTCWVMILNRKGFDLDVFGFPNLQTGRSSKIEAFSIQGHGPWMLKVSNSTSWDPKTSNSKVLTSCRYVSGCQNRFGGLRIGKHPNSIFKSQNFEFKAFSFLQSCPRILKIRFGRLWIWKHLNRSFYLDWHDPGRNRKFWISTLRIQSFWHYGVTFQDINIFDLEINLSANKKIRKLSFTHSHSMSAQKIQIEYFNMLGSKKIKNVKGNLTPKAAK